MLRRLRANGPVVLVPLAWTFATAAHVDAISPRAVLIGHLVMDTILVAFTVLSWREMTSGVLRAWKIVLLAGTVLTLAGTAGLLAAPPLDPLLTGTVVGWMVVPAAGLAYTARHVDRRPWAYGVGAGLSAAGALAYLAGVAGPASVLLTGLALAGAGQTLGIVAAVVDY